MQAPPQLTGGERRALSPNADVIIHDTEDGVILVVDNRDAVEYVLRFDFTASRNIVVRSVGGAVEKTEPLKCHVAVGSKKALNLAELAIADPACLQIDINYTVHCYVKHPVTGQLQELAVPGQRGPSGLPPPVIAPAKAAAGGATPSGSAAPAAAPKAASPTKVAASPAKPKGPAALRESECEVRKLNDTLWLHIVPDDDNGYHLFLVSKDPDTITVIIDFSPCENLVPVPSPTMTLAFDGSPIVTGDVDGTGQRVPFARLDVADMDLGSASLLYKVALRKDSNKTAAAKAAALQKAEDEAMAMIAAKQKAEADAAAKKKAEADAAAAAKKKAEDDTAAALAKQKADEAAAAKKKAEEDAALEAAKKAAADEAARQKLEAEAAARRAAEAAAAAAAKKAADEAAAKKAAADEAARKAAAERAKVLQAELDAEPAARAKAELEQRQRWILVEKQWRESTCALCRGVVRDTDKAVVYKLFRLHPSCYEKAGKCSVCSDVLLGEYVTTKGNGSTPGVKLHRDCIAAYKTGSRPTCKLCNKQILEDKWTTQGANQFHTVCKSAATAEAEAEAALAALA